MGFTSVTTYGFRNLKNRTVDLSEKNIFFIGENGQGKTNFLETVYLLCFGSSFRTKNERLLVTYGEKEMSLIGTYGSGEEGEDYRVLLKLREGKKEISVNEKRIRDRKELVRNIPCIVFSHDDIEFIDGPPERKRWFLNQTMSLFNPLFIDTLRRYGRLVKMRNTEIREGSGVGLEVFDQQIALAGRDLQLLREKTVEDFNRTFVELYGAIAGAGEEVSLRYRPSWPRDAEMEDILSLMRSKRDIDREMGYTTTGPHRDRLRFQRGGKDFSKTASTGQLRLMSLVLRVAQAVFFQKRTGKSPVLLLDDVLLELDEGRKKAFMESLPEYEQAFFTFLPDERYKQFYQKDRTLVYEVEEGGFTPR